jgi:hypothetical protein
MRLEEERVATQQMCETIFMRQKKHLALPRRRMVRRRVPPAERCSEASEMRVFCVM